MIVVFPRRQWFIPGFDSFIAVFEGFTPASTHVIGTLSPKGKMLQFINQIKYNQIKKLPE